MANVVGVVNDIFDILGSNIKKADLEEVMMEMLMALDENGVLDGSATELNDCYGIHEILDKALDAFYTADPDMEDEDDEDEDYD